MTVLVANAALMLVYATFLRKYPRIVVTMGGFQLFLILALRGEFYGADAAYYSNGYTYITSMNFEQMLNCLNLNLFKTSNLPYPYSFELAWVVINWLFGALGFSYRAFIVALSAFMVFSFCLFLYRYSKDPGFSLFVFSCLNLFLYSFYILRQTSALCICLLAVPFLLKRKPVKFVALVFLAFLFHRSALIFLILYPLFSLKVTKRAYGRGILAFSVVSILSLTILPSVIQFLFEIIGKSHWIDEISFAWNNFIFLQLLIVLCCWFCFDIDEIGKDRIDKLALWGMLTSCVSYAAMLCNEALARANEYLWIFIVLLIPTMLQQLNPHMRTLGWMLTAVLLLWFLVYQVRGSSLDPYISMFG